MTATNRVKPNQNLRAMLEEIPEKQERFEMSFKMTKRNSLTSFMNAFANVYVMDPELAFLGIDLILEERGIDKKEIVALT